MKFNLSDLRLANENVSINRRMGNDALADYWAKRSDEISTWLEAKKARAARRRQLKKAGLYQPVKVQPDVKPIEPINFPDLDWSRRPEMAMVKFALSILKAEGITNCPVSINRRRSVSCFRYPRNEIEFSARSIAHLLISGFREYAKVQWVLRGFKNENGESALKLLAIHEVSHAVDWARHGFTHHHDSTFQHIELELLKKYAEPAFNKAGQPILISMEA